MMQYLKLAELQLEKRKSNNKLDKKYEKVIMPSLEAHFNTLYQNAEVSYIDQSLYAKGVNNVTYEMRGITRAVNDEMKTDDTLPREIKEQIGLELYLAIKPMLNSKVLKPVTQYDSKGNITKEYEVVDNEKYQENLTMINTLQILWNNPEDVAEDEIPLLEKLVEKFYRKSFFHFNKGDFNIAINGYEPKYELDDKIGHEKKAMKNAMEKKATSSLINKLMLAGVKFVNLKTEEIQDLLKDGAENQEILNQFDNYLIQNGYNTDFTLAKKG